MTSFSMGSFMRRMDSSVRISFFDIDVGSSRLVKWSADLQSFRPIFPGAPGIIFDWPKTSNISTPNDKTLTVFSEVGEVEVEVDGQKQKKIEKDKWRYCGEYRLEICNRKDLGKYLTAEVR